MHVQIGYEHHVDPEKEVTQQNRGANDQFSKIFDTGDKMNYMPNKATHYGLGFQSSLWSQCLFHWLTRSDYYTRL